MLHENLKKIRAVLNISQQEMADKLNVNINTYRGYEYNKRELPIDVLQKLIYSFCINMNWFLTNNGKMFQDETADSKPACILSFSSSEIDALKKIAKQYIQQHMH